MCVCIHVGVCHYTLNSLTAHSPSGSIWVGTDSGNVIMMAVHVKSPATKEHSRTIELIPCGNVLHCVCSAVYN